MDCCNEDLSIITYFLNDSNIGLILNIFLTGLLGSFTHCIGMCGPIAVSQMSMRLMHLSKKQMSEKNRLLCAASVPYYLGKSIAYSTLGSLWFLLAEQIRYNYSIKLIGAVLMIFAAILFLANALPALNLFKQFFNKINFINTFAQKIAKYFFNFTPYHFGLRGWLLGFLLGLIPCGLLYSVITVSVTYSNNATMVALSLFLFGIATIPGLFLISYLGEELLIRWRKFFDMLYSLNMLFNAYLLFLAAFRYAEF
jgi:sulfite exporter TauE/SafE